MTEWAECESQLKVITLLLVIYKIISKSLKSDRNVFGPCTQRLSSLTLVAVYFPMRLLTAETTTFIQQSITTSTTTTTTGTATKAAPTNDLCEIYGECDKRISGRSSNNSSWRCVLQEKPSNKSKNQNEMYLFS